MSDIIIVVGVLGFVIYMIGKDKDKKTEEPNKELNTNTNNKVEEQPVKTGNPSTPPTIQETGKPTDTEYNPFTYSPTTMPVYNPYRYYPGRYKKNKLSESGEL